MMSAQGIRAYGSIERKQKKRTAERANGGTITRKRVTAAKNRLRSWRLRGEV